MDGWGAARGGCLGARRGGYGGAFWGGKPGVGQGRFHEPFIVEIAVLKIYISV